MGKTLQASLALSVALLAWPALAEERRFDIGLHAGGDHYDAVGLRSGLGGVRSAGRLQGVSTHLGATAIYRSDLGEIGVIGEIGRPGQAGGTTLLGALLGLGLDVEAFRLEALGELGAHRYGDLLKDGAVTSRSRSEAWLVSVGLRPGLSIRFGPGDMLLLGVWAFARWDLTSQNVQVSLGSGNDSTYKLGGSQYGASVRVGFRI
jgi:hypothetical protein